MAVEIRTLRVQADMDAAGYAAGAQKKVAADQAMGASGKDAAAGIKSVGDAASATETKISQAGNGIERLKRQFVTGYAASVDFERSLKTVGIGLDKGKISAEQASVAVENLTRKYGQVANAAEIAERGQLDLSRAVSEANARMAAQVTTAEQAALAQRRMAVAANENHPDGSAQFRRQNLGFQLQDIGVSLYGGMPITTVLAQQGSQIAGIYAGNGGVNAALKDFGAMIATATRYLGPFVVAGTAAYGVFQLLKSYSVEASLAVSEATKALAAQAAPLGTLQGQIGELTSLQETYTKAIADSAKQSTSATSVIIANTEREFNARKALLELEQKRQQALIETQRAEVAILGNQLKSEVATSVNTNLGLERRGFADPKIGRFINTLPDDLTGLDKTRSVLENSPLVDKIKELKANLELTEIGAQKLDEALKKTFDSKPYGEGDLPVVGPVPGKNPRSDLNADIDKETKSAASKFEKAVEKFGRSVEDYRADIRFEKEQLGRSELDQSIAARQRSAGMPVDLNSREADDLREIERIMELREQGKGFVTDLANGLRGGEDIGEAFGKAILDGLSRAADKQLDRLIDSFMSWLFPASASSPASGGTGIVGSLLGAANDNKRFAAPVGAVTRSALPDLPTGDIASYIAKAASDRGIDPSVALRVARSEGGLKSWNRQSEVMKNGIQEPSFGPYQLYMGGGLGNAFQRKTGLDPRLAANGPAGVDFALDHASKNGWGSWYGAANSGIGDWEGIGKAAQDATTAIDGMTTASAGAAQGIGGLASSLASGLGGGGAGGFGKLAGGFDFGSLFSSSWKPNTTLSSFLVNGHADGVEYSQGGLAMVGERGRELVNLPRGAQVVPNHRTENLMSRAANGNSGGGRMQVDVAVSVDDSGNLQKFVKKTADDRAGAAVGQRFSDFGDAQRRGGVNELNRRFASQKG